MADSGGAPATTAIQPAVRFHLPPGFRFLRPALLAALVFLFAGCGVQAPPLPPRVEIPQPIKDLRAAQVGRTLQITFTLPVLAVDGEQITKPVGTSIFRAVSPAGQESSLPDTNGVPWLTLSPKELRRYTHAGKADYPLELSPQEFRRQRSSAFAFAVIAFTRGFRGRPRKSLPSNLAVATLLDVTRPVTHLTVKATQTTLLFTWERPAETLAGLQPSHLSGYRVYQSATGNAGSFKLLGKAVSTHFDDKTFQFGQQYHFRVSAVTEFDGTVAESEPSAPVVITPRDVFPPPVPTGLTAVNAAGAVDLLWNASSASDLAGYNVYRSEGGGPFERVNKQLVPTPIFHDASVAPGRHYRYAVTSVDLSGNESRKSAVKGITAHSSARHYGSPANAAGRKMI